MLLTIDIGNTNITLGLYEGENLGSRWRLATVHERMPDEYGLQLVGLLTHAGISPANLTGICLASVVPPLTDYFVQACRQYLHHKPLVVNAGILPHLNIRVDEPHLVGADRLVDVVAALTLYGGPACIVDFGTATKFEAIAANGDYLGGAIAPGLGVAADGLFRKTAKLPRIPIQMPPNVIGRNTVHAMQSGLLHGYVSLVEGMVSRFGRELRGEMKVIATGGYAPLIAGETDVIDVSAPWLTLEGLRIIWESQMLPENNLLPQ